MTITRQDQTLVLKDGTQTVTCSDRVEVGGFVSPGPGEYDVSGVSAIILPGLPGLAAVIAMNSLSILYLDRPVEIDPESDDVANIDLIVTRVNSAKDLKEAQKTVKGLAPSGWLVFGSLPFEEVAKELSLTSQPLDKWNVTKSSLPEEGMLTEVLE